MTKIVKLNALQIATMRSLARISVTRVIRAPALADYKANVINGLVNAGALERFYGKHVRITNATVELKLSPVPRAAKPILPGWIPTPYAPDVEGALITA